MIKYVAAYPNIAPLPLPSKPVGTGSSPISVLIADDHAAVLHALRLLLEGEEDVEVVAEVSDLTTVIEQARSVQPHVLVLDLDLPGGSSIHTIGRLHMHAPETQIVLLTLEDSPVFATQALAAGASGLVAKHHADSELPRRSARPRSARSTSARRSRRVWTCCARRSPRTGSASARSRYCD